MTEQPLPSSEINGKAPDLQGQPCEAFVVQSFSQNGSLVDPANIAFILSRDRWYRLYFDHGFVFWRDQNTPPESYESVEDGWAYQLTDLLPSISDGPAVIESVTGTQSSQSTTIAFRFVGGRQINVSNDFKTDTTSHSVI